MAAAFNLSLDAVVMMDEDGTLTSWNPAAEELLGWSREEAVGRLAAELLVPPVYREAHEEGLRRLRATGDGPVLGRVLDHLEARHRDGRHFPIELRISEAGRIGDKKIFVAYLRDISDRKRAERLQGARHSVTRTISAATSWESALDELLQALSTSLALAVAEVWVLDDNVRELTLGGSWHIPDMDFSGFEEASRAMTFRRGNGLPGRVWADSNPVGVLDIGSDMGFARSREAREYGLRSALAFPLTSEDRVVGVIALYGKIDDIDPPLLEALGDIGKQLGQFLQRTRIEAALREAQEQVRAGLEFRAFHDALTGLPNRQLFDDRLHEALAIAEREKRSLALLLLDLDDFKTINDQFGHLSGDAVLKETAARLRQVLRGADTVARLGGDEFAIIPHGSFDDPTLARLAGKIVRAFQPPFDLEVASVTTVPSVGGALYPRDAVEPRLLVRNADAAMYHAKRNGLGFATYAPGMAEGRGGSQTPAAEASAKTTKRSPRVR